MSQTYWLAHRIECLEDRVVPTHPLTAVPAYHSLPSAEAKLYLVVNGIAPGADTPGVAPLYDTDDDPTTFSDQELADIGLIWQAVAEDFAPFNLDVTTENPTTAPQNRIQYVAIGGYGNGLGGISGIGTFGGLNSVSYVYSESFSRPADIAECASHEAGHAFGLLHQQKWENGQLAQEYYVPDDESWGPLMGIAYGKPLSIWHNGTAGSATTLQDDMAVLGGARNGFGFRPDDHGDTSAAATPLPSGADRTATGLVNNSADADVFSFTLADAGPFTARVSVDSFQANLDAVLELRDAAGTLLATAAPAPDLGATLGRTLAAGGYTLTVRGTGEYGRVGRYALRVATPGPEIGWPRVVGHTPSGVVESGPEEVTLTFDQPMDTAPLRVEDVSVSFTQPDGQSLPYAVTGAEWLDATRLRVQFYRSYVLGEYTLVLATDRLRGANGLGVDQDGDGLPGEEPGDRYAARFTIGPRADSHEPNNTPAAATDLGSTAFYSWSGLSVHQPGDADYFRLTAIGSGPLTASATVSVGGLSGPLTLTVASAAGAVLGTATGITPRVQVEVAAGAAYYVLLTAAADVLVEYYHLQLDAPGHQFPPPTFPPFPPTNPPAFPPPPATGPARAPVAVGAPAGQVAVYSSAGGQYGTSPVAVLRPFEGYAGAVRVATGDVDGDGSEDTAVVTGPGTPIRLAVFSGADNATFLVAPFDPFGGDFTGGGFVAAGDLDGDGKAEFIVTPDEGGGPRVSVFSLAGGTTARANFLGIDDTAFRGGARAAVGDINGDGTPDVIVAAGFGGGPRTAIFNGASVFGTPARLVNDFFAFPGTDATNLRNGSFVAAGDVTGDGAADLIVGGGPGGAPRVFILSGALISAGNVGAAQAAPVANFFVAGDADDRGGIRLAAKDVDGDNQADVVAGSGEGRPSRVRVYLGKDFTTGGEPATFQDIDPFGTTLSSGVFVG